MKIIKYSTMDKELFEIFSMLDITHYLTDRQLKVVKLKLKGHKNIEIAEKLNVCPATITKEFYKIRDKLKRVKYYE